MSAQRKKRISASLLTRKGPAFKFLGVFVGLMLLFYLAYYSAIYQNFVSSAIEGAQAKFAGTLLRLVGLDATVHGDAISGNGFAVQIAKGCDGIEPMAMFLAAIIAFPIAWKLKWPGIISGAIALAILNVLRIAGLFIAGIYIPAAFEFLHLHGGFVLFTTVTIIVWMIWANWAMKRLVSYPPA